MKSSDIRRKFIDYFKAQRHQEVPSSSLVPADDPTLLFTNAGMVQFKRVFQGLERRDYTRAVTCQKCVRAGGKHNDLEQVGHTARHHTFFEMLGNFSFGDYFKKEAIEYAWEWVTSSQWLGIDPDRLYVTVHHSDDEARKLWRQVTGIADSRIFGLGDKDNFWQMGDTGPCGPCSEILVDIRSTERGARSRDLSLEEFVRISEAGQLLEIWNLVFMQFDQQPDGTRSVLPAPSVDTGAGLERISAVVQNVPSNFDTDLFLPIIAQAVEIVGRPYDHGPSGAPYRVLADHARAVAFLLADGVYPSNEGRGYVLRRILRRAVRHAWLLGRREPTLAPLTRAVTGVMGEVYPELGSKEPHIERVTRAEEERFLETIEGGLSRLDELKSAKVISGDDAFKLYDTYGFPIDLTQMIAGERGQTVDVEGFERALGQQRRKSRAARKARTRETANAQRGGEWVEVKKKKQKWIGYDATKAETEPIAFRQSGDQLELVLEENPFYAESGGQVSDTGVVQGDGWELTVEGVEKVDGRSAVVGTFGETFEPTRALAQVNELRRRNIERNHTATHLVHAALRKILGTHVHQAGSVVAPERLRFDFSHHGTVKGDQLAAVEAEVNAHLWENIPVETREMAYKDAIGAGAMALFGEKYGDIVRVVDVPGISLELCGGTHVGSTGQIALFRFTHETGAAAGVRRIEALTGPAAYRYALDLQNWLNEAAGLLKTQPEHLAKRIESMLEENRKLAKRVDELLKSGTGETGNAQRVGDIELHVSESDLEDRNQIAVLMDGFRAKHKGAISVLFTTGDRAGIHVAVTDDLVAKGIKAADIANAIAATTGGKGGGRPHFASAGVGDVTKLGEARARTAEIVREFAR
ncbi:MAG TPA: alanine--tRNA ligase [Gemmatimonadales bacterium]|jgi:alanyl-tRNA synthetase|nr:alanine--tRNA ligase [Gemmatimonadales bacterium]